MTWIVIVSKRALGSLIFLFRMDEFYVFVDDFQVFLRVNCHLEKEVELEQGNEVFYYVVDHHRINCYVVA